MQCTEADPGCGSCHACRTTLAGGHPDVTVVATDRVTITIDEVRHLVGLAQRRPASGKWRVIIIEDADRMPERTSNLLLKAIEEPPPRTVWVLCAPSPDDVVVTIRSRCRGISLRVPPVEAVADLLVRQDGVSPEIATEAARAAQSHIGLARRLARDPQVRQRRAEVLKLASGVRGVGDAVLVAADLVEVAATEAAAITTDRDAAEKAELMRALGAHEGDKLPPALRSQVRQLEEDQKRRATRAQRDVLDRAMVDLLSLYRDALLLQLGAKVDLINSGQQHLVHQVAEQSAPQLNVRRMAAIATARQRLAGNVAPLLAIEAMLVELRPQAL